MSKNLIEDLRQTLEDWEELGKQVDDLEDENTRLLEDHYAMQKENQELRDTINVLGRTVDSQRAFIHDLSANHQKRVDELMSSNKGLTQELNASIEHNHMLTRMCGDFAQRFEDLERELEEARQERNLYHRMLLQPYAAATDD